MKRKIKQYGNPFLKKKEPLATSTSENLSNLKNAIALHQQGQFGPAEAIYKQLLGIDPKNADALHLLGVIALQTGHHKNAVDKIGQAIEINPNVASYYSNQGIALKELKQFDTAVASYDKAIALKPDFADAYSNRGVAMHELKQFDAAVASCDKAIALKPDFAEAYANRGTALKELKQFDAAVASYDKAIALKPDYAEAYSNRGIAMQELKQFDAAVVSYDKAIALKPDYADAYSNRGIAMQELKQFDAAVASCNKAIALKPDFAEAYLNRGNALKELKQFDAAFASYDKAIALKPGFAKAYSNRGTALKELKQFEAAFDSYDKAVALQPDFAEAYSNRGNALKELKQFDAAVASYEKAIALKPDFAEAYSNRGIAMQELKQFDAAVASYDKAIALKPGYAEAHYNRGLLRLVLRDFSNGFLDCKYRWDSKDFSNKPQKTKIPSASKSGIKGRMLIWAEQGIGDEIFYAGLLHMLTTKDVSITLSADKRLHPIYKRSFPKIDLLDKNILMSSSVDTGFDAQAPIGDLGFLLDIKAEAIKGTRSPYLQSDPVKRDSYRGTISALGSGLVCGVAWKSVNAKFGTAKSIGLDSFSPLLGLPGVHFVNLQYGDVKEEIQHVKSTLSVDVHQVPGVDVFNDIDSLLALIDACDVIVTTSNVTAHLAGSIGKRAAVLVPHSTGKIWYWHENDEHSFWYPSLKLFYQNNPLTWDQTIEDCADWVKSLL
jgi:tetratricopeptide (TPR) repeat protein